MNWLPWRRRLAYIGLGSNLDDPEAQIERAIRRLGSIPQSRVAARSSLYRSAPFGPVEQPDFINAVAALSTRLIDLDLLVYGTDTINEDGLTVPHPGIGERNFVLLPLREIAPDLVVPGLGRLAGIAVNENEPRISRVD